MEQKPNWQNAPAWAQYWAVDPDGVAYWHQSKPRVCRDILGDGSAVNGWYCDDADLVRFRVDIKLENVPDWTKTLQTRPTQAAKGPTVQPEYYKVGKGRNMHTGWPDSGF
jgi:hypothetical protein